MKIKPWSFFTQSVLAVVLLFVAKTPSLAAFPPVLVIGGTAYPGTEVDGSGGDTYFKYTTSNSVVLLHGATGGVAAIGSTETAALTSPTTTGTWDGELNVYLTGTTVAVPQVLVYYPAVVTPAVMQGYNAATHQPAGSGPVNGQFVVAYNGLPNGYIFNFGTGQPIYRYQAGTSPLTINTTNGWPPPNVFIFPSEVTYSGETLTVTSYANGMTNGYWANVHYATTDGTNIYCDLQAYIAPDGSGGQLYGDIGGTSVSAQWDSTTQTFVASPDLGVGFDSPASPPTTDSNHYGPPQIACGGTLIPFAFNDVNGSDVYWNPSAGTWAVIDSSDSMTINGNSTATYDPGSQMFYNYDYYAYQYSGGLIAVSADGTSFLGNFYYLFSGESVVTIYNELSVSYAYTTWSNFGASGPGYYFTMPNGHITQLLPIYQAGDGFALNYSYGSYSPVYSGNRTYIDATNGWPTGDLPPLPTINQLYINGQTYNVNYDSGSYNGVTETGEVYAVNGGSGFDFYAVYDGSPYHMFCTNGGGGFPNQFEINSSVFIGGSGYSSDGSLYISCPSSVSPQYGPTRVFWNGNSLNCTSSQNGTDTYGSQVSIDSNHHVVILSSGVSGTYNPGTSQFSIAGLIAQDANGNLLGTPPGLVIDFTGYPGDTSETGPGGTYGQGGQSIQLGDGNVRNSSNSTVYTVARNDGTWFVEYMGIPSSSVVRIQDSNGAYSSPVYSYSPVNGNNVTIDTTSSGDWPAATTIYPPTLYINGQLATLDSSSEIDGGYSGSVNYLVQPNTGDSFTISWSWTTHFSATTTGTFLTYAWSSGTWNGNLFGGLPSGLFISTQSPPQVARFGPQQIVWNGVQLTLDKLASSISGSNPTGADVYHDSLGLGLQVVVASDGTTTITQSNGTVLTGTYNASTHQFQFSGNAVGSLKGANSQGFAYSGSGGQTPVLTQDTTDIAGNLDIHGNLLTFGNWTDTSGNSIDAFCLAFVNAQNNQPNLLNFAATRQSTEWVWSHAATDQGDTQVISMVLSPTHVLQLFNPSNATTPTIVLDPGGKSHFEPQGNLSMGEFTQQPQ